jgi:hypothetical protein
MRTDLTPRDVRGSRAPLSLVAPRSGSELNSYEIDALLLLKRRHARPGQRISARPPTLGQAVRWIAELGGYTGTSSGGPPGSVTIRRGLEYLAPIALALECLQSEGKMRSMARPRRGKITLSLGR